MEPSSEQPVKGKKPPFIDWKQYQGSELKEQLKSLGIIYTPPQENRELREKIGAWWNSKNGIIDQLYELALNSCLRFLESGMMEDSFKNNEDGQDGRHQFLLGNKIKIGDREITLYQLAKEVNKMTGNKISLIISVAYLFGEELREKGSRLKTKIEDIKEKRGYFKPADLQEVYQLALEIINHILST